MYRFRDSGNPAELDGARGGAGGTGVEEEARSLMSPIKPREGELIEQAKP